MKDRHKASPTGIAGPREAQRLQHEARELRAQAADLGSEYNPENFQTLTGPQNALACRAAELERQAEEINSLS